MTIIARIATWWWHRCRHDWRPLPGDDSDAGYIVGYHPSTPHLCTRCGRRQRRRSGAHSTDDHND